MALVITGMVPYRELGGEVPIAEAFQGKGMRVVASIIFAGALVATHRLGDSGLRHRLPKLRERAGAGVLYGVRWSHRFWRPVSDRLAIVES